jgi:hypothetical protein
MHLIPTATDAIFKISYFLGQYYAFSLFHCESQAVLSNEFQVAGNNLKKIDKGMERFPQIYKELVDS